MKIIEVKTTQNVIIRYELATVAERWIATSIDWILSAIFSYVFISLVLVAFVGDLSVVSWGVQIYGIMPILLFFLYQIVGGVLFRGKTIGRTMMGIRVLSTNGDEVNWVDYVLRTIFYLIDFYASIGFLGSLFMSITPKAQRLGDLAANTTCVKTKNNKGVSLKAINDIGDTDGREVYYPQVTNLSDADMLIVKKTLDRYRKYKNDSHKEAIVILTKHLCHVLDIQPVPKNKVAFLKQLLSDYIVSTR